MHFVVNIGISEELLEVVEGTAEVLHQEAIFEVGVGTKMTKIAAIFIPQCLKTHGQIWSRKVT